MPLGERLARLFDLWSGEAAVADTPLVRRGVIALRIALVVLAAIAALSATRRVWSTKAPAPLAPDDGEVRFGLDEAARKKLFAELVADEPEWRKKAHEHFKEAWRADAARAAFERDHVRALAGKRRVNVTVAYLVLDEGVRKRWPGPGGAPVDPNVVPLQKK